MKFKIYDNSVRNCIFYITYSIYLIYAILGTSFYRSAFQGLGTPMIVACLFALLIKECVGLRLRYKDIAILVLLAFLAVLTYRYTGGQEALLLAFIYTARDVNTKHVLRLSFWISLLSLVFIISSSYLGLITNYTMVSTGRSRQYLGFLYSLNSPSIFCNILFIQLYLKRERISCLELVLLFAGNLVLFMWTDSRLIFALSLLALVIAFLLKCRPKWQDLKIVKLFPLSYIIGAGLSLVLTLGYSASNGLLSRMNAVLSGRLQIGKTVLSELGIKLFGRKIALVGYGLDAAGNMQSGTYNYVDNLYIQILLRFGLLLFVAFLIVMTYLAIKAYRKGDKYLVLILALLAVHAMIDDLILQLAYNSFWLVLSPLFIKRKELEKEDLETLKDKTTSP